MEKALALAWMERRAADLGRVHWLGWTTVRKSWLPRAGLAWPGLAWPGLAWAGLAGAPMQTKKTPPVLRWGRLFAAKGIRVLMKHMVKESRRISLRLR